MATQSGNAFSKENDHLIKRADQILHTNGTNIGTYVHLYQHGTMVHVYVLEYHGTYSSTVMPSMAYADNAR